MKRKLIKQGISALTVTLPTKWAEKLSLKPGDEIEVEPKEDKLEISALFAKTQQRFLSTQSQQICSRHEQKTI